MNVVYKIMPAASWAAAQRGGTVPPSADDARDGFIHLSTAGQVPGTLARHFAGQGDLVLLKVAGERLAQLRYEAGRDGTLFPHLYGALPLDAVLGAFAIRRDAAGSPILPCLDG